MSSFWERKLGGGAQVPQGGPQQHAPASSRPWWSTTAYQQAEPTQWQPEGSQVLYDAAGNAVLVGPNGQVMATNGSNGDLNPESVAHHTKSARKAKSETTPCPKCGGNDYATIGSVYTARGQVETKRCFDCGFPADNRESGTRGVNTGQVDGRARQVEYGGVTNQFAGQQTRAPAFADAQGGPGR